MLSSSLSLVLVPFSVLGDDLKSSSHHISYSGPFQLALFLLSSLLVSSKLALLSHPTS